MKNAKRSVKVVRSDDFESVITKNHIQLKLQMIKNALVLLGVLYLIGLLLVPPWVFSENTPTYAAPYIQATVPTLSETKPTLTLADITILKCRYDRAGNVYNLILNADSIGLPALLKINEIKEPFYYGELTLIYPPEELIAKNTKFNFRLTSDEYEGLNMICNA
ncbi:MAG: hypothetical protein N3E37_03290 [Candidatus Micrarchaeota archaeon]|nr:hypothetical protein [Candidatus Micrarchaeota archaeon]